MSAFESPSGRALYYLALSSGLVPVVVFFLTQHNLRLPVGFHSTADAQKIKTQSPNTDRH